jgi:two-component system, NarL family, response regulator DevR
MDSFSDTIRVLVVDDHPMVREGLRSMLDGSEIEIVTEAGTAAAAVEAVERDRPDVILLDIELADGDGLSVLAEIKDRMPGARVLIVTMHDESRLVRQAIAAGAAGYVLKGVSRRELLAAIRAVRDGESVLDPELLRGLVAAAPVEPRLGPRPADQLTAVDCDVLRLVAQGLTNREIAGRMRWSVATAKKYVQRILGKLGVSDRTQAAVEAMRIRLLD